MRAYHRVDPLMDEHKGHYTPAQFGAFLKVQLMAGRQKDRGFFRSVAALRNLLPAAYERYVDFLLAERDIVVQDDGRVYVEGWEEWQEGDLTVKDRMSRLRDRKRNEHRNESVTGTVTLAVTEPYLTANANANATYVTGEGSGEGVAIEPDEPYVVAYFNATGKAPSRLQRAKLFELCDRHSVEWLVENLSGADPLGHAFEVDTAWRAQERRRVTSEERAWTRAKRAEAQAAAKSDVVKAYFDEGVA